MLVLFGKCVIEEAIREEYYEREREREVVIVEFSLIENKRHGGVLYEGSGERKRGRGP
jgi:hypothetical protein